MYEEAPFAVQQKADAMPGVLTGIIDPVYQGRSRERVATCGGLVATVADADSSPVRIGAGNQVQMIVTGSQSSGFPVATSELEAFGLKFSSGGSHISRTMMLQEIAGVLAVVPVGAPAIDYRVAIVERNVLGKPTDSTRQKTLRHLRELYGLDETVPIFGLLRKLHAMDPASLPLLALQVAWARDPLLRATTRPVLDAFPGDRVETSDLALAVEAGFPDQYSELNRNKVARNAASTWTQSGHLAGRGKKVRQRVAPSAVAGTMALFLGQVTGSHGAALFDSPWCRLLDLSPDRARALASEAHRAGLLNLRAIGDVIDVNFPLFAEFQEALP